MIKKIKAKENKKEITEPDNDHYWLSSWGEDFFRVNSEGHLTISPDKNENSINLYELVRSLVKRGIEPPILFRFDGIIKNRIANLYKAFESAIKEYEYENSYQWAFPIKVNQQKHVIDVVRKGDGVHPISLEVGSKPELIAVLSTSVHDSGQSLLLCNGYKDEKYIELALLSRKIGTRSIIIIEQPYELQLVLDIAKRLQIEPEIGIRIKPHSKGSGKWASSGGELAKFGLNTHEINMVIKQLKDANKDSCLKLLHFHIGSQATSIIPLKKALREAARMYTEIAKLCPSMSFFDVGGGLAVDYDGSQTTADCSMNYTLEQYARDVVHAIGSICKEEKIPQPMIISESGRAVVAHHSVLVTEVIDVSPALNLASKLEPPPTKNELLNDVWEIYNTVGVENCLEALHDSSDLKQNAIEKFIQGDLSLEERSYVEKAVKHLSAKIVAIGKTLEFVPDEILKLEEQLLDIYFCNFSIFQSLPDAWAIQQLFPVMPIHRLNTIPTRKATIVDLTCDSDGSINQFVQPKKITKWLNLHEFDYTPYYLGIFLVGAYQEILGGLHNLFGDTNAVHVHFDDQGICEIKNLIEGDSIREVLGYVQYNTDDLMERLRCAIEKALKNNHLTFEESAKLKYHFKQALESYTYLVV